MTAGLRSVLANRNIKGIARRASIFSGDVNRAVLCHPERDFQFDTVSPGLTF